MELDPKCLSVNATARMLHSVRSILAHRWSPGSFWIPAVLPLSPPVLPFCPCAPSDPLDLVLIELALSARLPVILCLRSGSSSAFPLSPGFGPGRAILSAPGDPLVLVPVEHPLSARSQ